MTAHSPPPYRVLLHGPLCDWFSMKLNLVAVPLGHRLGRSQTKSETSATSESDDRRIDHRSYKVIVVVQSESFAVLRVSVGEDLVVLILEYNSANESSCAVGVILNAPLLSQMD